MANHRGAERPNPDPDYRPRRAGNTGPQQFPQQVPPGVQPMRNPVPHAEQMPHFRPPYTGMPTPPPVQQGGEPPYQGPGHPRPMPQPEPPNHRQPKKGVAPGIVVGLCVLTFALGYFVHNQPDPKALPAAAATQKASPKAKTDDKAKTASLPPTSAPKPKYVEMPNLVGQNAAIAKDALVELGFDEFEDVDLGTQDTTDTIVLLPANWTVTRQSHPAGSRVKVGDKIVLTCSKNQ